MRLPYPEAVTHFNSLHLRTLVERSPLQHPGMTTVEDEAGHVQMLNNLSSLGKLLLSGKGKIVYNADFGPNERTLPTGRGGECKGCLPSGGRPAVLPAHQPMGSFRIISWALCCSPWQPPC